MVHKKSIGLAFIAWLFLYMVMLNSSCSSNQKEDSTDVKIIPVKVHRFEKDLFSCDPNKMNVCIASLQQKYGSFFDLFAYQVTRLGSRDSLMMAERFTEFISDTNFLTVYRDCENVFGNFNQEEIELSEAFAKYSSHFPDLPVPKIITLISAFSYPVIADSSTLALSLDMYLGTEYYYYFTLDPPLPLFIRNRMKKEYLVPDAMRGWLESDFSVDESNAKLIDMILSQGRILCALKEFMPDKHDTLISGYSFGQLEWCRKNESKIWSFLIDQNLLFSDNPDHLLKFSGDGPTTNGFPKESPGNIGKFIGWQIVKSYLKNNKEASFKSLMEEKDIMKIFRESKYKPANR